MHAEMFESSSWRGAPLSGPEHSTSYRSTRELNNNVVSFSAGSLLEKRSGELGLLSWIVVGIAAGWIAEKLSNRDHGLLTNLVVGIIGALLGGFLVSTVFGFSYVRGINAPTIAVATLGALLLLWLRGNGERQNTR